MMRYPISAVVIAVLMVICSCNKSDQESNIDCSLLLDGLIHINSQQVGTEINKLTKEVFPLPTSSDIIGHEKSFEILIQSINAKCAIVEARLLCYACIYTLPARSEVEFLVDSLGEKVRRVARLSTPQDETLDFLSVR